MRDYELVVIVNPEIEGEAMSGVVDKLSRFITDMSGVVEKVDQWGKRRLAYPIGHSVEGNYMFARFKLEPKSLKEFETTLRGTDGILRHLVVKAGD